MKIHYIITTILFICMIILGTTTYLTDLTDSYSQTVDLSALNNTQKAMDKTRQEVVDLSKQITDFTLSSSPADLFFIPYEFIQIGWSILQIIYNSWETLDAMIKDIGTGLSELGITLPEWVIPMLISMLLITIIAILIYGFFKWKFDDK